MPDSWTKPSVRSRPLVFRGRKFAPCGSRLHRIGATIPETRAYVEGLRHGGALVFATGADEALEAAGNIMNRLGAVEIEEVTGPEPEMAGVVREGMMPAPDNSVQAGRIRPVNGGACFFVW